MPIIKFKKGNTGPSGLTLSEPAFDYSNNKLYIGVSGGTGVWVGAEIDSISLDQSQTKIPTQSTIKSYLNGLLSGSPILADEQEFDINSANLVWTKPTGNCYIVTIHGCGAGSGGDCGTNQRGGHAGVAYQVFYLASEIGATASIVIGAGGSPGTTLNGCLGARGGDTIVYDQFGTRIVAAFAGANSASNTTPRNAVVGRTDFSSVSSVFGNGGKSTSAVDDTNATVKTGRVGGNGFAGGPGGGGAGAASTTNTLGGTGGAPSSRRFSPNNIYAAASGGATGGSTFAGNGFHASRIVDGFGEGAGGGGGGATLGFGRGIGGSGIRGSGGGGGGIGTIAANNGPGGTGGDGFVRIITLYSVSV